jgi:uncharacterized protein (TIGR02453 family)
MKNNFPHCAADFLSKLSKNNNREWFESHRDEYGAMFLEPAQEFVVEMGEKLQTIRPNIIALPKIDKSIFRLHRDVRFSKDKLPYKTNLGIIFWEGDDKKLESSGFYFHIEPKYFRLVYLANDWRYIELIGSTVMPILLILCWDSVFPANEKHAVGNRAL